MNALALKPMMTALMVALARRNGLPWDAILGAEIAGDYKPKPHVYLAACEAFDLKPDQCMMVAAHSSDLAAAAFFRRLGHVVLQARFGVFLDCYFFGSYPRRLDKGRGRI